MRIIAGKARGTRLNVPKGVPLRPTLDRVREALFSILMPRLPEARFLDLFAGTGANGVEALSRGASHCTFADNDVRSLDSIRKNVALAKFETLAAIRRITLPQGLQTIAGQTFNIIFADPPFQFEQYEDLLASIKKEGLLAEEGVVVIEHARKTEFAADGHAMACWRRAEYGDVALSFFS